MLGFLKAWFNKPSKKDQTPIKRYTPLNIAVGSNVAIDFGVIEAFDHAVSAPIPYSLMSSLTVEQIRQHVLFGDTSITRFDVVFVEKVPNTDFNITLSVLVRGDAITSTDVYFGVETFYPATKTEWTDLLNSLTETDRDVQGVQYQRAYYTDRVQDNLLDYTINHEAVFNRVVEEIGLVENFRIRVINGSQVEYEIGYEMPIPSVVVNF